MDKNQELFAYFEKNYWNYYIELEEQVLSTRKYVAFDSVNFKAYSSEYLKLLVVICSEIDIVAKEIAHQLDDKIKIDEASITKWWFTIQDWFHEGNLEPLKMIDELKLNPWAGYKIVQAPDKNGVLRLKHDDGSKKPSWWDAYTKVKHTRTLSDPDTNEQYFKLANLGNVLNAIAALYSIEKRYMMTVGTDAEYQRVDKSKLFEKSKPGFYWGEGGCLYQVIEDEE